jgi:hypothetical protein
MAAHSKIPWPATYLERLEAVTAELRAIGAPTTADTVLERFSGVTAEQVEAILTALVLFGRIDKRGGRFSIAAES